MIAQIYRQEIANKRTPSKFSLRVDQRGIVLQNPSGVVGHILDNLLGGEDFVYLGGDATG